MKYLIVQIKGLIFNIFLVFIFISYSKVPTVAILNEAQVEPLSSTFSKNIVDPKN